MKPKSNLHSFTAISQKRPFQIGLNDIVGALVNHCERLAIFPYRGIVRDDILPGLRITHFRKRTVIAFVVLENRVEILGIFHGGRNYAAILRPEE